jgi:hypothetical protein
MPIETYGRLRSLKIGSQIAYNLGSPTERVLWTHLPWDGLQAYKREGDKEGDGVVFGFVYNKWDEGVLW